MEIETEIQTGGEDGEGAVVLCRVVSRHRLRVASRWTRSGTFAPQITSNETDTVAA